jgi:TctA family transporter
VERNLGASEAAKLAWAEARADFGRHFAVAFILLVISVGGAATIGSFSMLFSIPSAHNGYMSLAFAPARMAVSVFQGAFSAAVAMWMLASFAALSDSRRSA